MLRDNLSRQYHLIAICGGNGAGKSTVARYLAAKTGWLYLEIEDYYFKREDDLVSVYKYERARSKEEVARLLGNDLIKSDNSVIAATRIDFCEEIERQLSAVIHLEVPTFERVQRVRERSHREFGKRMLVGGDLYEREEIFFQRVQERPLVDLYRWYSHLRCPVYMVDGMMGVESTVDWIIRYVIRISEYED